MRSIGHLPGAAAPSFHELRVRLTVTVGYVDLLQRQLRAGLPLTNVDGVVTKIAISLQGVQTAVDALDPP